LSERKIAGLEFAVELLHASQCERSDRGWRMIFFVGEAFRNRVQAVSPGDTANSIGVSSVPPVRPDFSRRQHDHCRRYDGEYGQQQKRRTGEKRTTASPFSTSYGVGVGGNNGSTVAVGFGSAAKLLPFLWQFWSDSPTPL
jgi:hypothetical protein